MIGDLKNRLFEQIKPPTDLRAAYRRLKADADDERSKLRDPGPVVGDDVSPAEFARRYTFLRWSIYIVAVAFILSAIQMIFAQSIMGIMTCALISILTLVMVTAKAYRAWLARLVWRRWGSRGHMLLPPMSQFFDEVGSNPRELLPTALVASDRGLSDKKGTSRRGNDVEN